MKLSDILFRLLLISAMTVIGLYCTAGAIWSFQAREECLRLGYARGGANKIWPAWEKYCIGEKGVIVPELQITPIEDARSK